MSRGLRTFVLLLLMACTSSRALLAQKTDSLFTEVPFARWAAAPEEQTPWKVMLMSLGLTVYQRPAAYLQVDIWPRYLEQRTETIAFVILVQFTDSAGREYQDHGKITLENKDKHDLHRLRLRFNGQIFVLPGDYDVAIALYDPVTGKHSFSRRKLHVEPLGKDPFPDSWRELPTVEFLNPVEGPDAFFHPESVTRLHLALPTQRPVRIEVVANLTGSERAEHSHRAYWFNLSSLLPILKTLSQVQVSNGVLNFEALDLVRRKVVFEQNGVHELDWQALKNAVAEADPTTIDVRALEDARHKAAFLRGEVAHRLQNAGSSDALPILVLISSSSFFNSLDDLGGIPLPAECQCVVYYLRYSPVAMRFHVSQAEFDNVKRVLKPLKVRNHMAESPRDLRRILAEVFDELSKM